MFERENGRGEESWFESWFRRKRNSAFGASLWEFVSGRCEAIRSIREGIVKRMGERKVLDQLLGRRDPERARETTLGWLFGAD